MTRESDVMTRVVESARHEFPDVDFNHDGEGWKASFGDTTLAAESIAALCALLRREAPISATMDAETVKARLSGRYPGWSVWRSDHGLWYATLRARLTEAQRDAGRAQTLQADTSKDLAELLAEQEQLAVAEA
ncbi:hypothetical protein [Streptosporangium sp. NPDC051022]|uniref:hypothetical protein n=1 Tax=Streptosporangium sp. NPDC051022 TaxID=3155752 RepID=UPI0034466D9C